MSCAFFTLKSGKNTTLQPTARRPDRRSRLGDAVDQPDDQLGHRDTRARPCPRTRSSAAATSHAAGLRAGADTDAITCSTFRCCRLYSWMRLTWTSKSAAGSTRCRCARGCSRARRSLFDRLTARQRSWNAASSACGSRASSRARSVIHPSPIASSSRRASAGLLERQEAPRRHAVGHVAESIGPQLGEVAQHRLLEQLECSSATPLTPWLPTVARFAIRTRFVAALARSATSARRARRRRGSARAPRRGSGG